MKRNSLSDLARRSDPKGSGPAEPTPTAGSKLAAALLKALTFAARKHRDQRRKDAEASPYIDHPIEVAEIPARSGGVDDVTVLPMSLGLDSRVDMKRETGVVGGT